MTHLRPMLCTLLVFAMAALTTPAAAQGRRRAEPRPVAAAPAATSPCAAPNAKGGAPTLVRPLLATPDTLRLLSGEVVANAGADGGRLTLEYLTHRAPQDTTLLRREADALARATPRAAGGQPIVLLVVRACRGEGGAQPVAIATSTYAIAEDGSWRPAP